MGLTTRASALPSERAATSNTAAYWRRINAWKRVTPWVSRFAVGIGIAVLLGWAFDIRWLKSIALNLPVMVPNTALCLVLCGLALEWIGNEQVSLFLRRMGQGCAFVSGIVALLTLGEYLFHANLGVDLLLVRSASAFPGNALPGRPSPQTAFNLCLLSGALLLLSLRTKAGQKVAQLLAIAATLVSLTALIGYLNQIQAFYRVSASTGMAPHTLLACLALSIGLLCAQPDQALMAEIASESAGGIMARRLLPAVVLAPLLLGWLRYLGERTGLYRDDTGISLMVLATIALLTGLLLVNAQRLNALDARRQEAIEALQKAKEELENGVAERTTEIEALNQHLRRAMSETHHRVKNNLQVISALVDLQRMEGTEFVPMREMERLGQHIGSLAVIHDLLTHQAKIDDRMAELDMRLAVEKLLPMLQALMPARPICANIAEMRLPIRPGTSLTILINELVSNAGKHGRGDIEIDLTQDGKSGCLVVRDHGPGFPPGFDPRRAASTGLDLIASLTQWDLLGTFTFENADAGGARVVIVFPLDTPQEPLSVLPE